MKPVASVSVDLDNHWSYLKTHGDASWEELPSYLDRAVPRALGMFSELGITATFFIVGLDAEQARNDEALGSIAAAGHEIGNHSFFHEPWMNRNTTSEVGAELERADEAIARVTGRKPIGFRGPGFTLSESILEALAKRGYKYDASTLPTFIGPLARAYYFRSTDLTEEQKAERATLFGDFSEGRRPNRPYSWDGLGASLAELPVTTMPGLRTPIHVSYLLYLSRISPRLASAYLEIALRLLRITDNGPSMLLHPLDFLGGDDVAGLEFFPGMDLGGAYKTELTRGFVAQMVRHFEVVGCAAHVESTASARRVAPRF